MPHMTKISTMARIVKLMAIALKIPILPSLLMHRSGKRIVRMIAE